MKLARAPRFPTRRGHGRAPSDGIRGRVLAPQADPLRRPLLVNGYNHFADHEGRTQYAEYKGVPAASALVLLSGAVLGSIGVVLGVYPVLSAGALAVFLVMSTVLFHDFWAVPEEERQNELNHFLKNVGLLGAALVFVSIGTRLWAYAVNLGFF